MKLSTFCILLVSALMLMGTLMTGFIKGKMPEETIVASAGEAAQADEWMLAVSGQVVRRFGAEYSEALGQWTQNEELTVSVNEESRQIKACGDLTVEKIEQMEKGACVTMEAGNAEIRLWPVRGVRVFVGSRLRIGDAIAEAGEQLNVSAVFEGNPADPAKFVELTSG